MKTKKCYKCNGTGKRSYYYDGGDHFSAGPAHNSEWRTIECECMKGRKKEIEDENYRQTIKTLLDASRKLKWQRN